MSKKDWQKLNALEQVVTGAWTMTMGAQAAGLSVRQLRRLRRAYEQAEDKVRVVVHGNRGRRPTNRLSESVINQVVELREGTYKGFNDSHFTDKLVEVHKLQISRQSVQRILRGRQVASPQGRRARKRRKRRERRSRPGWLVLWDGSIHDWLEGRGPVMCLMGAIDDATGKILRGAHFVSHECSAGYLRVLLEMARHHGVPLEIYADRHSSLRRNDDNWTLEEQLAGRQELPQVQRAADALGVEFIWATSPQAKGRIERAWRTFQDRLVSELRLAGVTTLEEANKVLERYRREHNRRFARKPKDARPAWRKPAPGTDLAEVCAFHTTAKVNNDSTVQYQGKKYDLQGPARASIAGKVADIRHLLTGRLKVYVDGHLVHSSKQEVPTKAPQRRRHRPPSAKPKRKQRLTFKEIVAKRKSSAATKVA